jgi:hypothetical protein
MLVFFVNVILDRGGIYAAVPWIDMPIHFLGGASIAVAGITFLSLLRKGGFIQSLPLPLWIFLVVSFVGLAAVSWELWEFSADFLFKKNLQKNLADTMTDMFFGLLGGSVTSVMWAVFLSISHRIR